MNAVEDTGSIFLINNTQTSDHAFLWIDFFIGLISIIVVFALVASLALPKSAKILGPVAFFAFVVSGLLVGTEGIMNFVTNTRPWAYSINLIAVCLIVLGLAFGLSKYSYLLDPDFKGKK